MAPLTFWPWVNRSRRPWAPHLLTALASNGSPVTFGVCVGALGVSVSPWWLGTKNKTVVAMDMFGHVWTCLDMFGHVWTCLDMFGHVWTCLDMFGHVWTCLQLPIQSNSWIIYIYIYIYEHMDLWMNYYAHWTSYFPGDLKVCSLLDRLQSCARPYISFPVPWRSHPMSTDYINEEKHQKRGQQFHF